MLRRKYRLGKGITFWVPTQVEPANKTVTYKIKFIEGVRFMGSLLLPLIDNLAERLHSGKCKDCISLLEYIGYLHLSAEQYIITGRCICFCGKCIKIYKLGPGHIFCTKIDTAYLKNTEFVLELLTDADMLLKVKKGIGGGMCHAIHR